MPGLAEITQGAKRTLAALTGLEADNVAAVEPLPGGAGWRVTVELVEKRSIPAINDLMVTIRAELDGAGEVLRYERVRRYLRRQEVEGL